MGYRAALIKALQQKFPDYGLTYSIGGKISFDIFPIGWDKTYALGLVADEQFEEIHFFGDKTYKVGSHSFHLLLLTMWNRVEMIMKYSAILELLAMLLTIQMTQFRCLRSSFSRINFSYTHQSIEYHCKIYLNQDGCVVGQISYQGSDQ